MTPQKLDDQVRKVWAMLWKAQLELEDVGVLPPPIEVRVERIVLDLRDVEKHLRELAALCSEAIEADAQAAAYQMEGA